MKEYNLRFWRRVNSEGLFYKRITKSAFYTINLQVKADKEEIGS